MFSIGDKVRFGKYKGVYTIDDIFFSRNTNDRVYYLSATNCYGHKVYEWAWSFQMERFTEMNEYLLLYKKKEGYIHTKVVAATISAAIAKFMSENPDVNGDDIESVILVRK